MAMQYVGNTMARYQGKVLSKEVYEYWERLISDESNGMERSLQSLCDIPTSLVVNSKFTGYLTGMARRVYFDVDSTRLSL
ncbi:hypothetical protein FRB93_010798 [Tulasnella sp. JGI-2019a]|nr:hypothetical protein FRB93_010798 [Tulasnella sp. JGI-2019a]